MVLARERNNLRQIIEEIVDLARTHSSEAEVLKNRLAEAEKVANQLTHGINCLSGSFERL